LSFYLIQNYHFIPGSLPAHSLISNIGRTIRNPYTIWGDDYSDLCIVHNNHSGKKKKYDQSQPTVRKGDVFKCLSGGEQREKKGNSPCYDAANAK
jgi:hypothetical protein